MPLQKDETNTSRKNFLYGRTFLRVSEMVIVWSIMFLMAFLLWDAYAEGQEIPQERQEIYWKDKYGAQKRKSFAQYKRIKVLNARIRALRGNASPLQLAIAPWTQLAECESGNNWKINSGNGFYGGVQFNAGTWRAYGGTLFGQRANYASPIQQVAIAERVLARQGRGAWPHCSRTGAW